MCVCVCVVLKGRVAFLGVVSLPACLPIERPGFHCCGGRLGTSVRRIIAVFLCKELGGVRKDISVSFAEAAPVRHVMLKLTGIAQD